MTTPTTSPKRLALSALLAIAASLALPAQAQSVTCYTVRDGAGKVIEQSTEAPVDMGQPLRQAVADKYGPSSRMTFMQTDPSACPSTVLIEQATPRKRGDVDPFYSRHIENNPEIMERKARLEAAWAAKRAEQLAHLMGWEPRIGMKLDQVSEATRHPDCRVFAKEKKWCGGPERTNITRGINGRTEQWVFRGLREQYYLYFHDGILRTIQE